MIVSDFGAAPTSPWRGRLAHGAGSILLPLAFDLPDLSRLPCSPITDGHCASRYSDHGSLHGGAPNRAPFALLFENLGSSRRPPFKLAERV